VQLWTVRAPYVALARRLRSYRRRDRVLAPIGSVLLLTQLVVWLALSLGGYTLLLMAAAPIGLEQAFRAAGSAMLTLGYADPANDVSVVVDFVAAANGLAVIALLISYLPTLYSAYNRRETEVTAAEPRWPARLGAGAARPAPAGRPARQPAGPVQGARGADPADPAGRPAAGRRAGRGGVRRRSGPMRTVG